MPPRIDLAGQRFGDLLVTEYVGFQSKNNQSMWVCRCDCGNLTTVARNNLGKTRSCGCYKRNKMREQMYKHGAKGTPLYSTWKGMRSRCNNPNNSNYHNYGGRRIQVCPEWDDFLAFREWANANGYVPGLQIDRIDNDKGYSASNCRWVTPAMQARNKRTNRMMTFKDKTQCVEDWSQETGISADLIRARLDRLGWCVARTLTVPAKSYKQYRRDTASGKYTKGGIQR
jgi:hypothetical protein